MQADLIEVMHQQVRTIHRALTGDDVPITSEATHDGGSPDDSEEVVARRFAELAAIVKSVPSLAERVPPFAFTPALDVIAGDLAVVLEMALCGVRREDVAIEHVDGALVVRGIRRHAQAATETLFHAEIPRGPFLRVIPLPFPLARAPRIELADGLLRIHVDAIAPLDGKGSRDDTDNKVTTPEEMKK